MALLPLGSIVTLKDKTDHAKYMLVLRRPLATRNGIEGYVDYAACVYPKGVEGDTLHYFNHEHIKSVLFKGYVDEYEEKYQKYIKEKRLSILS